MNARFVVLLIVATAVWALSTTVALATPPSWMGESKATLEEELVDSYGREQRDRIRRGLRQVADFWRIEDGARDTFEAFVRRNFAGDQATLDTVFERFEKLLEQLDGHMLEILIAFRKQSDLDVGAILPFDEKFAAYNPAAHVGDDFFANKLAFVVLLNFPVTTLDEKLTVGENWTRRQWAETRLAGRFAARVPAEAQQAVSTADAITSQYIAEYNIWMHHLLTDSGERLFPPKMKLLSHWNLRDEIRANYSDPDNGLEKQRMIQQVMTHIVEQSIPATVVNNPHIDWAPYSNTVSTAAVSDVDEPPPADLDTSNQREPDTRYEVLLGRFKAERMVDAYTPTAPTRMDRSFNINREIPEDRVIEMFDAVLTSPALARTAKLIEERLGRPLEPFDIWYNGFRSAGTYTNAQLDALTRERFPTAQAYEDAMPELLVGLGFKKARAKELAANIVVEPARGSGHAWGAAMRDAKARLRTRVGTDGMDYKGFNIAVHEMGHNVEQTISLNDIDYVLLNGVPNTAFTEALAFVFQARDLELLGLDSPGEKELAMRSLDDYWGAAEIGAVALVDIAVWHWMYDNPEATPAELRAATVQISKDIWNRYFAGIFGVEDVTLLGIYSHMINRAIYLPDYPIGAMISRQIENHIAKSGELGSEFERMSLTGNVAPDLWMTIATGQPVGPDALINSAEAALDRFGK